MTRFAHDVNLEFPLEEEKWRELFDRFRVKCRAFDDMSELTQVLTAHQFEAAYLPVANQYYLRNDPFYRGIATALTKKGSPAFKSVLVVKRDSSVETWEELQGKKLGYIHCYCTSSYFGGALFLSKRGAGLFRFFSERVPVGAWQKQVDAVVEGKVDATFVMEEVWLNEPKNRETTKIIDFIDGLPCPSILVSEEVDPKWSGAFEHLLLQKPRAASNTALFSGFIGYQSEMVESFFKEAEKALT